MYGFILNMWIMHKITEVTVVEYVGKGCITQSEADIILVTPQVVA